jgi:RNA recognition motif-containing protein
LFCEILIYSKFFLQLIPKILSHKSINQVRKDQIMTNKLYVGNLPFSATEDSIKELFAEAGTVTSANVIVDRDTNRSKGFGFVEMSTDEEAGTAINTFNGKDLDGRALKVSLAKPREPRSNTNRW